MARFGKILEKDVEVVDAMQGAPDIECFEDKVTHAVTWKRPEAMTDRQFKIAKDALEPARSAPLYLTEACRRVELAQKIAAGMGGEDMKLARAIVHVVEAKRYPVIDVTPVKKD
jgi:hypothetical protein